jgi:hypothetical protein
MYNYTYHFGHSSTVQLRTWPSFVYSSPLPFCSLTHLRHTVAFLGQVISLSQGLYLHRTTQHRRRTNIYPVSGIQTRDPVYKRLRSTPRPSRPLDKQLNMLIPAYFVKGMKEQYKRAQVTGSWRKMHNEHLKFCTYTLHYI